MTSLVVVHLLFWLLPSVFETWNAQTVDQIFVFRANSSAFRVPYDSTVVQVDLTDRSIEAMRNFYLNRSHYARVVSVLGQAGVAAQLWDYIYPARTNTAEDSMFFAATAAARNVYYGLAFRLTTENDSLIESPLKGDIIDYLNETKWNVHVDGDAEDFYTGVPELVTLTPLARASRGLGYLSQRPDRDGVFRRTPLLVKFNGALYPSFALRAICDYLHVGPDGIIVNPGRSVTLKGAHRPDAPPHDIVIPIDNRGNIVVNYVGRWDRMKHYDFATILAAADDRDEIDLLSDELKGKIVIVSEVSTGSADVRPVPLESEYPLSGLHANVLHSILTENFLRELSGTEMLLIEVVLMAFVAWMSLNLSSNGLWVGGLVVLAGFLLSAAALFLYAEVIVNVVRPAFMIVLAIAAIVGHRYLNEQKEKASLQRSFEAYFPPAVVKRIMANPELIYAAGQKKELTILFSDIKSFTTYSSTMSPDQIQKMLNEYFEAMVDIVFKYEGTVDKFIGDGLMVFFGDPEPQSDHAVRCVRAAIEMQKKCRELKARWETTGLFPLKIRVGINSGPVVVGNMGSARRLSYTVLGSDVNLAQRLESNAPVEGIMISQRTYELVKDAVTTKPLEPIMVKGLDKPIKVYEVPVEGEGMS